jgi:hypothetical protein
MKKLFEILYTIGVIFSCYVAYSTLSREWATSLATSTGIKGFILISIILVGINSIVWTLPERFLIGKIGRGLVLMFSSGIAGGMAALFTLFFTKNAGPLVLLCFACISITSLYQLKLLGNLLMVSAQDKKA